MADAVPNVPNLLVKYCANALCNGLNLQSTQVIPAVADMYDPAWIGKHIVLVIPGAASPEGNGRGAQDGGGLFRQQQIRFVVYVKFSMDEWTKSQEALTRESAGLMEFFESIRSLFRYTMFGSPGDMSSYLLCESFKWSGESGTSWTNDELGVVRRDLTYTATYAELLPTGTTLNLSDVQNGPY